jgi:heptaprenyl diphosphate synthase
MFGKKSAVITGDYLLCLDAMAAVQIRREFNDNWATEYLPSFVNICLGEYNELRQNGNINLSPRLYLKIISGKTAELFRLSAIIGTTLSGADDETAKRSGRFGLYLGLIFQIIDDCKDYMLTEESAQKPVKHDLSQGVVTLPLILALANKPELAYIAKEAMFSEKERLNLIAHIKKADAITESRAIAERYAKKAEKLLFTLFSSKKQDKLKAILAQALAASEKFA